MPDLQTGEARAGTLTRAEAFDQIRRIFRDKSITDRDERMSMVRAVLDAMEGGDDDE